MAEYDPKPHDTRPTITTVTHSSTCRNMKRKKTIVRSEVILSFIIITIEQEMVQNILSCNKNIRWCSIST